MVVPDTIVDDEPPARERLASLLAEIGDVLLVGEGGSGREALELTMDLSPDVVLLDVRMPDMDGLEAAQRIATMSEPPAVIFTTAYDEYAINAFEAQAAGYLVKPIRKDKLAAALAACRRLTRPQLSNAESASPASAAGRSHIPVRRRDGIKLIPLAEIRCFLADQKYTTVRHEGGDDLIELLIEHTHTCYLGERGKRHAWGYGCGACPACELRARGHRQWHAAVAPAA